MHNVCICFTICNINFTYFTKRFGATFFRFMSVAPVRAGACSLAQNQMLTEDWHPAAKSIFPFTRILTANSEREERDTRISPISVSPSTVAKGGMARVGIVPIYATRYGSYMRSSHDLKVE